MIRLAVFDIDRTLIPPTSGFPAPQTLAALHELKQRGLSIAIATGRQFQFVPQSLKTVGFDYYILSNGAYVTDGQGHILHQEYLDTDTIRDLTDDIVKKDLPMDIRYIRGRCAANPSRSFEQYLGEIIGEKTREAFLKQRAIVPNPEESAVSAVAVIPQDLIAYFREKYPQLAFFPIFGLPLYDINKAGISKATGLMHICTHLGLPLSDTIAFGDDRNDLELICVAGIGVAMGEGIEELKEEADFITTASDNLGVVKGLRKFNLID